MQKQHPFYASNGPRLEVARRQQPNFIEFGGL